MQPLLGLSGIDRLADERLFGDDVVDFEEIGQLVRFAADGAVRQHQWVLFFLKNCVIHTLVNIEIYFENKVLLTR